ncbi:MAG: hypothetical protein ABR956_02735 [Terracidiphilus sp.]|jgi:sphingomyelin phosphodiesterase acid-like 3
MRASTWIFRAVAGFCIVTLGPWSTGRGVAQNQPARTPRSEKPRPQETAPGQETVPVLMLSDIHFDPFFDPAKVPALASSPISDWKSILASAPSPDRAARLAALKGMCATRGEDTSYALLDSSLRAMQAHAAGAKFVTVSGDLMAHQFDCKFNTLFPHAAPGEYRAFAEKTMAFMQQELSNSFPGVTAYTALGNNDSDCGDYTLDAHSEFLSAVGENVTRGFAEAERTAAQSTFAAGGYYSVRLPAPMKNARLIVLDDLFMAAPYATCGGKKDATEAAEQLTWLRQQLSAARLNKEKVWVMSHIPPGVDLMASVKRMGDVCGVKGPAMYLGSQKIADTMVEFSDVVQLGIFAHTHMDEWRILKIDDAAAVAGSKNAVAVKTVSSISPINGNLPSFTVAQVAPSTAELVDYRVFTASNQTGVDATWKEEYDFGRTYGAPAFNASAVARLINKFEADAGVTSPASRAYIQNFSAGKNSTLLSLVWPEYVCNMQHDSAEGFKGCVCAAAR